MNGLHGFWSLFIIFCLMLTVFSNKEKNQPEPMTPEPMPESEPSPAPGSEPMPVPPEPVPEPMPVPEPTPEPTPEPMPVPEPTPEPTPEPMPVPEPTPEPMPVPAPTPEPMPVPEPTPEPMPVPVPTVKPPEPTPVPTYNPPEPVPVPTYNPPEPSPYNPEPMPPELPASDASVYTFVVFISNLPLPQIESDLKDMGCSLSIRNSSWPNVEQNAMTAKGYYNITTPSDVDICTANFTTVLRKLAGIPATIQVDTVLVANTTMNGLWTIEVTLTSSPSPKQTVVLYIIIGVITAVALIVTIVLIVSLNKGKRDEGYGPVVEEVDDEKYQEDPY